jgi:hypothetical protein
MIRTHKPSGHHWTCASHFQQSKQYRNLDAQDWHAPSAKILVVDPDDDLPTFARVAKRQRVEQLANGFLEGKPLFISSACANGPDLAATVDKILCEKGMTWNEVLDDYDADLWADGEDGWADLKKRSEARKVLRQSGSQSKGTRRSARSQGAISRIAEVVPHPDSGTAPRAQHKISTAPSDEALLIAAKLRVRKVSLVAKAAERLEILLPPAGQVTQSAPPTARAASSFKECSSSRPFNPNTPAETTMADELRFSRTESPSHRPRAFTMPAESFSSDTTVEDKPIETGECEPTATGSTAMELCTAEQNIVSSLDVVSSKNVGLAADTNLPPIASNPHSTWTLINDKRPQFFATDTSGSAKTPGTRSAQRSTTYDTELAYQQRTCDTPANLGESSSSTGQSRLTNSFKATKSDCISAHKSPDGTASFLFRKKTKVSKDVGSRRIRDPSEESDGHPRPQMTVTGQATPGPTASTSLPLVNDAPPTLDLSFTQNSSFAPVLSMALVDEHINRELPNSPGSAHRSSSVKKALRNEMRLSGAELTRAPGEPSSSQSYEPIAPFSIPQDVEDQSTHSGLQDSRGNRSSTGQWPGTQVLLNRAQHDLFMSPDKLALAHATSPSELRRDHVDFSEVQQPDNFRVPIRRPSHDHLPGTQALMDNWSPWSTLKKTKPGKRTSFAPSPLVNKNKIGPTIGPERSLRSNLKQPNIPERTQDTKQRRSSLHFSTSTSETPVSHQEAVAETNMPVDTSVYTEASIHSPDATCGFSQSFYGRPQSGTSPGINLDFATMSFAATAEQPVVDVDGSLAGWASHDRISFLQNAQRTSVDPPPETILADLATEFLSTADIDGVLGSL